MTCILSKKHPEDRMLGESTHLSTDDQQESSRVQPTTHAELQIEGIVTWKDKLENTIIGRFQPNLWTFGWLLLLKDTGYEGFLLLK